VKVADAGGGWHGVVCISETLQITAPCHGTASPNLIANKALQIGAF
jgi:hypothetical protein